MKTENSTLYSRWLKAGIIIVALCSAAIFFFAAPLWGRAFLTDFLPDYRSWFLPWLCLIWICSLPFFAALICAFRVSVEIGRNNSFSVINAKMLFAIGCLSVGDAALFFIGNIIFLIAGISHPGVLLCSVILSLIMCCAAIAALVLSRLICRAFDVAKENELTI